MTSAKRSGARKKNEDASREVGYVEFLFSGIARVRGLPHVFLHETLLDEKRRPAGIVIGFDERHVEALLFDARFDSEAPLFRSGQIFSVPVSDRHLGRVVDGLGASRDELPYVEGDLKPVFRVSPSIIDRDPVDRPLITGLKIIDATLPLGRGQRELLVGDRKLGKSTIAIDTVLHQKRAETPVHCVYVFCGQKTDRVRDTVELFRKRGAMLHTTVVAASADDPYAAQYLAPFVGCAIAEHFRDSGRDALVIYDDLSKHARAYRDINLLLGRPPGREMYPADIFSLHAGLLERAAQLSKKLGGGSLSALPIVETLEGDIASYVPTNLISITDGQIYLERGLKEKGFMPAVNVGLSVSRLGSQVQPEALKEVTHGLRLVLSQQKELQKLTQLETTVSKETQKKIHRGELFLELLKQEPHVTMRWEEQVLFFRAAEQGSFDDVSKGKWTEFERLLLELMRSRYAAVIERVRTEGLTAGLDADLAGILADFRAEFAKKQPV